jgi:IPT/TIG domain
MMPVSALCAGAARSGIPADAPAAVGEVGLKRRTAVAEEWGRSQLDQGKGLDLLRNHTDWLVRAGTAGAVSTAMTAAFAVRMVDGAAVAAAKSSRPDITAVSPASGPTAGGTEVQITGHQLLPEGGSCLLLQEVGGSRDAQTLPRCAQLIVYFGGEPGLVLAASPTNIDVFSPTHAAGAVDLSVTTADGTSTAHKNDRFTYLGAPPAVGKGSPPAVTTVSPAAGPVSGFTPVVIKGQRLLPEGTQACLECAGVSVRFGTTAVPVLEGTPEELLVASPPHAAGTVDVTVSADGLVSSSTSADRFTYLGRKRGHRPQHHRRHRHRYQRHGNKHHSGRGQHSAHGSRGHHQGGHH